MDTTPEDRYLELKGSFTAEQSERLPLEVQLYGANLQELAANWKGSIDISASVNKISELLAGLEPAIIRETSEAEALAELKGKLKRRERLHLPTRKLSARVEAKTVELAMLRLDSEEIYGSILKEYSFGMSSLDLSDLVIDVQLEGFDPEDLRVPVDSDGETHLARALAINGYLALTRIKGYTESARSSFLNTMSVLEHTYSLAERLPSQTLEAKTPVGAR